jgi:hypothetical protein
MNKVAHCKHKVSANKSQKITLNTCYSEKKSYIWHAKTPSPADHRAADTQAQSFLENEKKYLISDPHRASTRSSVAYVWLFVTRFCSVRSVADG